jgi:5-methyltetrahydrofolate--homocysteine methyltransferase
MDPIVKAIFDGVVEGQQAAVVARVNAALEAKVAADRILHEALIPGMTQVGNLFATGDYYVPEMLLAARAMLAGLERLRPLLVAQGVPMRARVVLGTVEGDLHDIGKNLVGMMLEGAGYEVVDLGVDVSAQRFADAVREHQPALVGMSALLTTTMPNMKAAIQAIEAAGLRDRVKVIVGGAPLTEEVARAVGADGFAPDASRAVRVAGVLLGLE